MESYVGLIEQHEEFNITWLYEHSKHSFSSFGSDLMKYSQLFVCAVLKLQSEVSEIKYNYEKDNGHLPER